MTRTILHGGRILDPGAGLDGDLDLLVEDGRIAAIEPPGVIGAGVDDQAVDVRGLLVVPGLIDLHGHWYDGSPYGLDPVLNLRGGVTTAVDAGTTGYANFVSFRRHTIEPAAVRVLAFIHVAAGGLVTTVVGELQDLRYARPREAAAIATEHRDVIVGVKVRLGAEACGANVAAAFDEAMTAAEVAGVPLMAHIADGADVPTTLARLRPGDILTHAFTASGPGILGDDGRVLPEAHAARARGVRFDVGHGCGSFAWRAAEQALTEGLTPDAISTDLHRYSIERPVVDLPTTMSRFLALGMSLEAVVTATTATPAGILGRPDLGTLRVGGAADITVMRLDTEAASLSDAQGERRACAPMLRPVMAMVGGDLHAAADVPLELRPFLDADREVDCAVPI